jgi:hypothetical protein
VTAWVSWSLLGSGSDLAVLVIMLTRYTPLPGARRDDADWVVVGPPPRAPEGSAGRQTTGRDLLAGLSRSTLAASSSIAEPSGNPTAHDEQEPRQEEGEHRES